MGGRIVSRAVSSNDFNNKCGSYCDDQLRKVYAILLSRLAPLLPSASQPGLLPAIASDAPLGLAIGPGGILERSKIFVLEKDSETGKPKTVLGPDEASLRRFAMRAKMPVTAKFATAPLTQKDIVTTHLPFFSPEIELAALKSVMLSFDCLLQDLPERFTRADCLRSTREAVRQSIESQRVQGEILDANSFGIQLEKLPLYAALREMMNVEETPFEHYMLAAGNLAQRCIDAVWVVFGFEPFGFRLCDRYDGPDFCYGLVNPILKGQTASGAIELRSLDELLCRRTNRRTLQKAAHGPIDQSAALKLSEQAVAEV